MEPVRSEKKKCPKVIRILNLFLALSPYSHFKVKKKVDLNYCVQEDSDDRLSPAVRKFSDRGFKEDMEVLNIDLIEAHLSSRRFETNSFLDGLNIRKSMIVKEVKEPTYSEEEKEEIKINVKSPSPIKIKMKEESPSSEEYEDVKLKEVDLTDEEQEMAEGDKKEARVQSNPRYQADRVLTTMANEEDKLIKTEPNEHEPGEEHSNKNFHFDDSKVLKYNELFDKLIVTNLDNMKPGKMQKLDVVELSSDESVMESEEVSQCYLN